MDRIPSRYQILAATSSESKGLSITDTPNHHGFFMLGEQTLYLCHMPMFHVEDHMYQVVLEASLPDNVMKQYVHGRKSHPDRVYNLINVESEPFTLPQIQIGQVTSFHASVYSDYFNKGGGEPGPIMSDNVVVTVDRVCYFRHFDYDFEYPKHLTYLLFGTGSEAHMSHFLSRNPDFQHLLSLPSAPSWLASPQLEAGVQVNILGTTSTPVPCKNPLTDHTYQVQFQGWTNPNLSLELGEKPTVWFSTGNLLNAKDPCAES